MAHGGDSAFSFPRPRGDFGGSRQRSALLLSGDVGAGHAVTAAALAAVLAEDDWQSRTVDSMDLLGGPGAAAGKAIFRRMLSVPGVYDAFHFSCLRPGTWVARAFDRVARRTMAPRLAETLAAQRTDVVIAVFATGASAAAEFARTRQGPPVIAFCTDVVPHRMWVHDGIDAYLVSCIAAREAVRRYQPHANIVVVPRPVRSGFRRPPAKLAARQALGLPPDEPCVLLMSGGWGLGPIAQAASALADAGLHVLAVAGNNAALQTRLRRLSRSRPRLRPYGFTNEIPALMAASDLVITSSGVTCSEARAVGRPLLLLDVVPGHGHENLQHELELGGAAVAPTDATELTAATLAALSRAVSAPPHDPTADFKKGLNEVLGSLPLVDHVVA